MIRKEKTAAALLLALVTAAASCSCGTAPDTENADAGTGTYTGSGYEYRAVVEDGEVIEPRSEAEADSFEESNCWKTIDSGTSLECEMYFPVEPDKEVTVQVLNPDGEDTVMAELTYTP